MPYSSKAYSECGVDECGESVGKDDVVCRGLLGSGVKSLFSGGVYEKFCSCLSYLV
jgi:hypothetical protein